MILTSSPYNLLQEIYNDHPWKMMVCCIMLNCTSRKQVDQVRDLFFTEYDSPEKVKDSSIERITQIIESLGFKNKRAQTIVRFSKDWVTQKWLEPNELYGIGKYGQDSWEVFQKGDLTVEPTDGVLSKYLQWARSQPTSPILAGGAKS